jgi:hypothetical protein
VARTALSSVQSLWVFRIISSSQAALKSREASWSACTAACSFHAFPDEACRKSHRDSVAKPSPVLRGQGCEARATLGQMGSSPSTPTGLRRSAHAPDATPLGLRLFVPYPRVALLSQPWPRRTGLGWRTQSLRDWQHTHEMRVTSRAAAPLLRASPTSKHEKISAAVASSSAHSTYRNELLASNI